jgi:hypothetical protein
LNVYGNEGHLGSYRANENGFMGDTRGVPSGNYTLQPKQTSGVNWPAGTPAITGKNMPVGKPGSGYKADAILLHPGGPAGVPDSRGCITVNADAFKAVMHAMHQAPNSKLPLQIR